MKKILLLAVVAMFAMVAMAQASTVSFSWGANYMTFADSNLGTSVGSATQLNWYADDFGYGIRTETNNLQVSDYYDQINVTEITVDKWLSNSVAIGLGIGSLSMTNNDLFEYAYTVPVVDVRGTVKLLSGKGEKVNASLDFNIDARFANSLDQYEYANDTYVNNVNATVATLAVTLGL